MTEAGVYQSMSNAAYQSETDWVSASMLKRFLPEWFKPFNGSPSADMGSILHQRFTGENVPVVPVDAATWTGKAAKEELAAIQASGEYAILVKDLPTIDRMEQALRDHPVASKLLIGEGSWETSVFAEVDGVPSRCRFDRITDTQAVDLKTTKEPPGSYNLAKAVVNYGYDLAADHYLAVAADANMPVETITHVWVMNCEPFSVTVTTLDDDFMARGAALRDLALQRFLHEGMVDSYEGETGRLTLSPPGWARIE